MLSHRIYTNAVVTPLQKDGRGNRRTGVIADGDVVDESLLRRANRIFRPVENPCEIYSRARPNGSDSVIFGGHVSPSFGHFLLESLARLWICRQMSDLPIAWIGKTHFNSWQSQVLELLGVSVPHIFVQSPEMFKSIVVPQVGYRIPEFFAAQHRDFLGCVPASTMVKGRKAWLSRSMLAEDKGRVLGEAEVEGTLSLHGWEIYHPQQHPILEQLKYLSSCEIIAGWEGSGFHSLVLVGDVKSALHIFRRGQHLHENYKTIADAKHFNQHLHSLPVTEISGRRSRRVWEQDTRLVIDAMKRSDLL